MSAQRRLAWIADGSPFRLATPARDLRDVLRGHGYTVYDIGNRTHLEAEPPEDHTPYSATGWPGTAVYGVGYAIDVMPPPAGLPSLQELGAQVLEDRNAGVAGIRWLKYMNWEPEGNYTGPCWHESWQPSYARRSSSDRGHIHLSGLTGYESSTIGAGYDPVARIRGDDMTTADVITGLETVRPYQRRGPRERLQAAGWSDMSPRGVLDYCMDFVAFQGPRLEAIEAIVRELADRPPVVPAPVDVEALAAALAPLLRPGVTLAELRSTLASTRLVPAAE